MPLCKGLAPHGAGTALPLFSPLSLSLLQDFHPLALRQQTQVADPPEFSPSAEEPLSQDPQHSKTAPERPRRRKHPCAAGPARAVRELSLSRPKGVPGS